MKFHSGHRSSRLPSSTSRSSPQYSTPTEAAFKYNLCNCATENSHTWSNAHIKPSLPPAYNANLQVGLVPKVHANWHISACHEWTTKIIPKGNHHCWHLFIFTQPNYRPGLRSKSQTPTRELTVAGKAVSARWHSSTHCAREFFKLKKKLGDVLALPCWFSSNT